MYFKGISSRIILSIVPIIVISTLAFIVIVLRVTDAQVNKQINEKMTESINTVRVEVTEHDEFGIEVVAKLRKYLTRE